DRPDPERIERLVRRLGARRWADRNRATRELVGLGKFSRERLLRASEDKDQDPEVTMRARDCLEQIERLELRGLEQAAARLLIKRREEAALELLLKLLPAEDEDAETDLYYGLEALGVTRGKVAPLLIQALKDRAPERRAVAACIVGWRGDDKQR